MTPLELYREGKLREAIKALGDELRARPLDAKRRTFLFELLLFAGEYDRAEKNLDVLAGGSAGAASGALLYRSALHAERIRQKMFLARQLPNPDSSDACPGTWNGDPFGEIVDADPRIGANLEVFIAGTYTWIPFRYLRRLEVEPPANLRDLVWARARIETSADFRLQDLGEVLLPVLAPLSFQHPDEAVQLGRLTVWEPDQASGEIPAGAKLVSIDGADVPLLELRSVALSAAAPEESSHAS